MTSEATTVNTALKASPHLDFTISILPGNRRQNLRVVNALIIHTHVPYVDLHKMEAANYSVACRIILYLH